MSEWKMVKIGEICEQINGVSYKPADVYDSLTENATVLLRANNIFEDKLNYDELVFVDKKRVSKNQYMKKGDILICASSGSKHLVGKAACLTEDKELTFGAFCKVLRPKTINPEYIKHYFFSPFYRTEISRLSEGANINNIKAADLENLTIPLPTESEQNRIAKQLDKCITIINKQKRALEKYDLLIKSRFIEMFGDPIENTKSWIEEPLGNCCLLKAGKAIKASELADKDKEHPYPCFGGNGIRGFISKKSHTGKIVLIGRQGALCGNVQLTDGDFYATEHAVVTSPKKELNSIWLYHLLFLMDLNRYKSGAAQPGLTVEKLNTVPTMIVPIELQNDFAAFVQQIDKSKFEYTNIGVAA